MSYTFTDDMLVANIYFENVTPNGADIMIRANTKITGVYLFFDSGVTITGAEGGLIGPTGNVSVFSQSIYCDAGFQSASDTNPELLVHINYSLDTVDIDQVCFHREGEWAVNSDGATLGQGLDIFYGASGELCAPLTSAVAPTALITQPDDGANLTVGVEYTFTADVTDPEGAGLEYFWGFGDGNGSSEVSPVHTFNSAGQWAVGLMVKSLGAGRLESPISNINVNVQSAADVTPPVITILGDNPLNLEHGSIYQEFGAQAVDETDGALDHSTSGVVDTAALGTYSVFYSATDLSENTTTVVRTVNIVDTTAPVITLNGGDSVALEYGSDWQDLPTAVDAVDGVVAVSVDGTFDPVTAGSYTITYTATDSSGNSATATRDITVGEQPADYSLSYVHSIDGDSITLTATIGHSHDHAHVNWFDSQGNHVGNFMLPQASEVWSDTVISESVQVGYGAVTGQLYGTDASHGLQGDMVAINVDMGAAPDVTGPVITLQGPNPQPLDYGVSWTEPGFTAVDDVDGDITSNVDVSGTVNENSSGAYVLTYSVTDSSGNSTSVTRTVQVQEQPDTEPPVITLTGPNPHVIDYGVSWVDPGYTATDNVDGDLTASVSVSGSVDQNTAGSYIINYSVSDAAGNTGTTERTVQVSAQPDTVPPTITLVDGSSITWVQGTPWSEPGYSASDDVDGDLTASVSVTGDVVDTPGAHTLTYAVTDSSGNSTSVTRTVTVITDSDPVLDLLGGSTVTVTQGTGDWSDPGVTATDYEDGDLTGSVVVSGPPVDTNVPGTYTITYTVTDADGNTTAITRDVIVEESTEDTTPPVITMTGMWEYGNPFMIELGDPWVEPGVSAHDNVDGAVAVVTDASGLDTNAIGSYFVNYTATDAAGNVATAQRAIAVCDNAVPVLTLIGSANITIAQGTYYVDEGATATDGGGDISDQIVIGGDPVNGDAAGTYTVEYNVSDASGNAATPIYRTVTVTAVYPVITLIGNDPEHVEVYGGSWSDPGYTATDPHDGDITGSVAVSGTVDDSTAGHYTLTYDVSNSFGNSVQETRMVHVGVHQCPIVEDLSVPEGTPDLQGLALAYNNTVNYNGTLIDVSNYTSGEWASLAANVGLSDTFVSGSALNTNVRGREITDTQFWTAFPLNDGNVLNINQYASRRMFASGVRQNVDGSTVNVQETIIKFIALQSERYVLATKSLSLFDTLAAPNLSYPFDWHCALDSKFAAQDIILVASNRYGIKDLVADTQYPHEFVVYRLNEMYTRGLINQSVFHRKRFGADGSGFVRADGQKYSHVEISQAGGTRATLMNDQLKNGKGPVRSITEPGVPLPAERWDEAAPDYNIYDTRHNRVDPSDPTKRAMRTPTTYATLPTDVSQVASYASSTIVRGLTSFTTAAHMTPEFLGGVYAAESAKFQPDSAVLDKLVEVAAAEGVDISSYTG